MDDLESIRARNAARMKGYEDGRMGMPSQSAKHIGRSLYSDYWQGYCKGKTENYYGPMRIHWLLIWGYGLILLALLLVVLLVY